MHIGVLTLFVSIETAHSLKEKRHAVHSLLGRIRARFPVSAAEVGQLDLWRRATLGVVIVSNDAATCHRILEKVADFTEDDGRVVLDDYTIEML